MPCSVIAMIFRHLCKGRDSSQMSESLLSCAKQTNFVSVAYYCSFIGKTPQLHRRRLVELQKYGYKNVQVYKFIICRVVLKTQFVRVELLFTTDGLSIIVCHQKPRKFDALTLHNFIKFVNPRTLDGSIQIETNPFSDRSAWIGKSPA
jgi:hypothetical protein